MSDFQTYQFKQCDVRYWTKADYLETVFQDGAVCPAQFTFDVECRRKAQDLGYIRGPHLYVDGMARAVRQMHLEHELAHTFIAEALGGPWCPVLRSVAVKGPYEGAWEREELVMAFQRFLNGQGDPDERPLDELGANPRATLLVREFKRRFRS